MATTFQIPRILQPHCGGKPELELHGSTVRAMLEELRATHPALYRCLCEETGRLRRHINIFVNDELLDGRQGLDARVKAGDVVSVFQAVSGGC